MLLDAAEKLISIQLVFTGSGASQQTDMQYNDVAASRLDSIENIAQVVEIEVIAYGHEDVASARADSFGRQFGFQLQIELIHLHVSRPASMGTALGNRENDEEQNRESAARHCGDGLREEIDDGDQKERKSNQTEADRDLHAADIKVEGHLEFANSGPGV